MMSLIANGLEAHCMIKIWLFCAMLLAGCARVPDKHSLRSHPQLYLPIPTEQYSSELLSTRITALNESLREEPQSTELYGQRGWLHAQSGSFEAAGDDLTRAIELSESHPDETVPGAIAELWIRRGIVKWSRKDVGGAISDYTRAIELEPDNWEPYFHRWQAYRKQGRAEEAASDRATGLRLNERVFSREYSFEGGVI